MPGCSTMTPTALDIDARILGFDMTKILDAPTIRTPAMMYLFHRIEQRLDGTPAIIVVDEGWKALDDDVFVAPDQGLGKDHPQAQRPGGLLHPERRSDALESRIASRHHRTGRDPDLLPQPPRRGPPTMSRASA